MYTSILFFVGILAPIPVIIFGIYKGDNPYKTCIRSIIVGSIGLSAVFILSSLMGSSIGDEFNAAWETVIKSLPEENQEAFLNVFNIAANGVPGSSIVLVAISSYLEYLILSQFIKGRDGEHYKLPPFREFTLQKSTLMGWLAIFLLSWIFNMVNKDTGAIVLLNVNMLFDFTFALQGISLILYWAFIKKMHKAIPVVIIIICLISGIGSTVLFILGILDIILGLRWRIKNRGEKNG